MMRSGKRILFKHTALACVLTFATSSASFSKDLQTASFISPFPSPEKAFGPHFQKPEIEQKRQSEKKAQTNKKSNLNSLTEDDTLVEKKENFSIAENPFKDGLKQTLNSLQSKTKRSKQEHEALKAFYGNHEYEPLWVTKNGLNENARHLIGYFNQADKEGLNNEDYLIEIPKDKASLEDLSALDIKLSLTLLRYARHAQAGRIHPASVSRSFKLQPSYPKPEEVILKLATSTDKVTALASYHPAHPTYKALKEELAILRAKRDEVKIVILPEGKTMGIGYEGERVSLLRQRLNVPALADEHDLIYDENLKEAIKAFQTENNLLADGLLGPRTLSVMNGTKANRIPDIIANMEHWRWMARDMGKLHVQANIPSFNLTVYKDNKNIHRTRVVVGKTKHKTPVFSDEMEYVVVNPYWNVPYSIASKELLPHIQSNPNYIRSRNYEVLSGNRVINPTSVNWNSNSFKKLRIRQRPGGKNALGDVKFLFPNPYAIYFHDTPSKSLFQKITRAFSHGCVRVHNPFEFGNVLMKETKGWKAGSLKAKLASKEKWIRLKENERVPVHLTYFTAVKNDDGTISYKSDIYGHVSRLKRILGLI